MLRLEPGSVVLGCELEREIGRGGFGSVWRARDPNTGAPLAIKFLENADRESARRFEHELQMLVRLDHPNIVGARRVATVANHPVIIMEFVDGEPLDTWAEGKSVAEKRSVAVQICEALQHAHDKGVLHRDLKMANILVAGGDEEPQIKIVDFGIAWSAQQPDITKTGEVLGTAGFMSPEQLRGQRGLTIASDVYACGVVLYVLFEGSAPFHGDSVLEVAMNQLQGLPVPPTVALPDQLWPTIMACISLDPGKRPTLVELKRELAGKRAATLRTGLAVLVTGVAVLAVVGAFALDGPASTSEKLRRIRPAVVNDILHPQATPSLAVQDSTPDTDIIAKTCTPAHGTYVLSLPAPGPLSAPDQVLVHVPESFDPHRPAPVLVAFHSEVSNPRELIDSPGLLAGADARGVVVLVPDGDTGRPLGAWRGSALRAFESLFPRAMEALCLRDVQLYMYGEVNGGSAAQTIACTLSANGYVTTGFRYTTQRVAPQCTVPTLLVSHLDDPIDPAEGGLGCLDIASLGRPARSIEEQERLDASARSCTGPGKEYAVPHGRCRDWDCESRFRTCRIEGGADWPGRRSFPQCATVASQFDVFAATWGFIDDLRAEE